ncbi:MAG: thiosulfohydrolase SoxB [Hyphomicrobiales bacterium]|nr:thiosulfohydrolase SoxB [Hyphomicrobiales bacterium]MBV8823572.1 thiosulfohydrolase SoxB [Hyphomicrobiales bacterium]MBV9429837.1 thiosulfohydrolase SoxB [Bradyrhizobiaceae bacterium]
MPDIHRRSFLRSLAFAAGVGIIPRVGVAADDDIYDIGRFGNVRVIHITDTHAQLVPVHYREPSVNIGVGAMRGQPPHLVGRAFLEHFGIAAGSRGAYAFTFLDYQEAAQRFGRMGGFAHLKTLIERLRADGGHRNSLVLDGGDLWQGSGLAQALAGADMVEAANLLGVEALTGHWEFTYGEKILRRNLEQFKGEFLAQNVFLTQEAAFNDAPAFDPASGRVFKPATIKEIGGRRIGIIGQAFPYVPVAHPKRFAPDWTFGLREAELQKLVTHLREVDRVDAVLLLSHNGMDADLKLASRVSAIDAILGGHTHDAVPRAMTVSNAGGRTLVTNAGSSGKFAAVLDLDVGAKRVNEMRYKLLPVFADLIAPDAAMQALIDRLRAPHAAALDEKLAVAGESLYRRGNFGGPMDQVICDALRRELDAQIALSPGFRFGGAVPAGDPITMDDVLTETAISYPEVYVTEITGSQLKAVLEDVADNLFNPDPYYQQGGDMVRIGGMDYACAPEAAAGSRISDMTLDDGMPVDAGKRYRVAGWASLEPQSGKPVSEVVANYLRAQKTVRIARRNRVVLKGVAGNPGLAE